MRFHYTRQISSSTRLLYTSSSYLSAATKNTSGQNIEYCRKLVMNHDKDGYLCSMFYPRQLMPSQWIIRAFNLETARIRENVSNDTLGQIRLQWWRDGIDKTFNDDPPEQPVLQALHEYMQERRLSKSWFTKTLNAREKNLLTRQYHTTEDLVSYVEDTNSTLLYLSSETLDIRNVEIDHIASHLGKTIGLVTILKSLPYLAQHDQFVLPANISAANDLSAHEAAKCLRKVFSPSFQKEGIVTNGDGSMEELSVTLQKIEKVVYEVASLAHRHLETAREHLEGKSVTCDSDQSNLEGSVRKKAFPVFLNSYPSSLYLKTLEGNGFDIVKTWKDSKSQAWKLPFQVLAASIKTKI